MVFKSNIYGNIARWMDKVTVATKMYIKLWERIYSKTKSLTYPVHFQVPVCSFVHSFRNQDLHQLTINRMVVLVYNKCILAAENKHNFVLCYGGFIYTFTSKFFGGGVGVGGVIS